MLVGESFVMPRLRHLNWLRTDFFSLLLQTTGSHGFLQTVTFRS